MISQSLSSWSCPKEKDVEAEPGRIDVRVVQHGISRYDGVTKAASVVSVAFLEAGVHLVMRDCTYPSPSSSTAKQSNNRERFEVRLTDLNLPFIRMQTKERASEQPAVNKPAWREEDAHRTIGHRLYEMRKQAIYAGGCNTSHSTIELEVFQSEHNGCFKNTFHLRNLL